MADADIDRMKEALRNAHAAGDVNAARRLATALRAAETHLNTPAPVETSGMDIGTGIKEFFKGGGEELTAAPQIPMDFLNSTANALHLSTPGGLASPEKSGKSIHPVPDFGIRERYQEENPVTPGYEGWREMGQLYLGGAGYGALAGAIAGAPAGGVGAIPGAVGGAVLGTGAATTSLIGEKLGEAIDSLTGNKDRRWEQAGAYWGGFGLPFSKVVSNQIARGKHSTPDTPNIRAAARRRNIEPSLSLLGGDTARNIQPPPGVFNRQLAGLNRLIDETTTGMRGTAPRIDPSRESMALGTRDLAGEALRHSEGERSVLQQRLENAVGGADTIHEPRNFINEMRRRIDDANIQTERSREAPQLQAILDDFMSNMQPRDRALHTQLQTWERQLQQMIQSGRPGNPAHIQMLHDALNRTRQHMANNLGVNEAAIRRYFTGLKSRVQNPSDPLHTFDISGIRDFAENVRADTAVQQGMTRAEWDAIQAATEGRYDQAAALRPVAEAQNTELGGVFREMFSPDADVSPQRIRNVQEGLVNPDEMGAMLAAQLEQKTRGLRAATASGLNRASKWFDSLGPGGRDVRAAPGTPVRQSFDDLATLSGEVRPYPGHEPVTSAAANLGSTAAKGAALFSGNPVMVALSLLTSPRSLSALGAGAKKLAGINREKALATSGREDLGTLFGQTVAGAPHWKPQDDQERDWRRQ